jgi:hypothetical protein
VELYLHSPMRLQVTVLDKVRVTSSWRGNWLNTETSPGYGGNRDSSVSVAISLWTGRLGFDSQPG